MTNAAPALWRHVTRHMRAGSTWMKQNVLRSAVAIATGACDVVE